MGRGTILNTIFAAMLGEEYAQQVATMRQRVEQLCNEYQSQLKRMDKALEHIANSEMVFSGIRSHIDAIDVQLKATEETHEKNKNSAEVLATRLKNIEERAEFVENQLVNSDTIAKAMGASKKRGRKGSDADASDTVAGDSDDSGAVAAEKPKKGRSRRNKAADDMVKEVAKQKEQEARMRAKGVIK